MNNIHSSIPQPLPSPRPQGAAAGPRPLDLSLPRDFGLEDPVQRPLDSNQPRDTMALSAGAASARANYSFLEAPAPPPESRPMTKGEFVARTREVATEIFGEGGVKALEVVGGVAHIARGGKVSYKKNLDTTLFESAQVRFEASAKNGGRIGMEFKATF